MTKHKLFKHEIGLFLTVFIWATSIITSSYMLDYLTTFQLLLVRFSIASVIFIAVSASRFKLLNKKTLVRGIVLGLFLFCGFSLQTTGLSMSTPANNAFLTSMYVVFVPIISFVIFKKKADKNHIIATVVAVIGAGVLSLGSDFSINAGDLMTVCGSIFYALHIFFVSEFTKTSDTILLTMLQFVTGTILCFIVVLFTGTLSLPPFSTFTMVSLLHLGIICTALCFFLQIHFQKYIPETKASIIFSIEAPIAALFSVALGIEALTLRLVLGSAIMFSALYIASRPSATIQGGNHDISS